ncbi:MAG: DUF2442 domain-containing protein [Cyanobacteriota bacterium]|jgi:hypothetical protein
MTLEAPRKETSTVEVTHISSFGLWILVREEEMFLSHQDFPWFKNAPVGGILNVEEVSLNHFYWPDLDIDLTAEMIQKPERFPLIISVD